LVAILLWALCILLWALCICCGLCAFCDHTGNFLPSTAVDSETYAELDRFLELQGPTSGVYQEADRLQQLQQQQQQLHQQQQQQQRSVDSEALQLNAFSSVSVSAAEADINPGFPQASQDLAGTHFDTQDQKHFYMCCCVSLGLDLSKRKDVCNPCQESLYLSAMRCAGLAMQVPLISLSTLLLSSSTLLSPHTMMLPLVSMLPVQPASHASLHAGEQEAAKQSSSQPMPSKLADDPRDQQPAETRGNSGEPETAPAHGPTTSASGMSLQPPSLPAHFSQQQQQQQQQVMPAQLVTGSVQDKQQAAAAGAGASPRDAGPLGAAGQKQAPKPPLAPGSKSVPQV